MKLEQSNSIRYVTAPLSMVRKGIFIRHGSTVTNPPDWKSNDVGLSLLWQQEIHSVAKLLLSAGINSKNSRLYYYSWDAEPIERIIQTVDILQEYIGWSVSSVFNKESGLATADKRNPSKVVRLLEIAHISARFFEKFVRQQVIEMPTNIQYIVFVVHLSNFAGIQACLQNSCCLDYTRLSTAWILSCNINWGKYCIDSFNISPQDFGQLKTYFGSNAEHLLILQDEINEILNSSSPETIFAYTKDKLVPLVFRRACLWSLIGSGHIEFVKEFLQTIEPQSLSILEMRMLIVALRMESLKALLFDYFLYLNPLLLGSLKFIFEDEELMHLYVDILENRSSV